MCGGILAALALIAIGALMLFNQDLMWELTEWNHLRRGITGSQRTPEWEFNTTLGGLGALALGIIALLIGLFAS